MDPKPFTYEHFIQAVQSLKDDMLMYYIDEAVAIYCRIKGKSVGPRPASSKDYLPEYADAFEAANYAIFITANKIGAYNPDKGAFRPYLRKALESALRDIFRVDGYETLSGSSEIENEPDTSASDAEERVRQHKDEAFETMIKFIDALPEIKRAAIYASAFGQILRPDLEGYGRNYADILADIYHTTALYIRQLATEGKKAALAEARRQGFSESSMNEVYMGMLQVQSPARDINDEVIQATEKLSPYQQFMLLRHLAVKEENGNIINTMTFEYKQENATLTPSQEALLGQIENVRCPFKGISHLKDLREISGVSVVIADRKFLVKVLKDSIERINDQISKYSKDTNRFKIFRQIERDIYSRCRWAEKQVDEASLLGLYSRKLLWFDNSSPTVFLFADNINDYAKAIGQSTDNVFGYVFIHEMMHAYYDSYHSDGFPSWEELEEPFAEFGMLTFIKKSRLPVDLLMDAKAHVQSKIDYGPREYGFGLELFFRTGEGDPGMIDNYRAISNWIDVDVILKWAGSDKYFRDIGHYHRDPSVENADKCYNGVKEILDYPWEKPDFVIQPKIRGSRSASGPRVASRPGSLPAIPRLGRTEDWAVTASKIDWHFQYPLIQSDDLVKLIAEVIRVMKNEGFESYLSFDGDKVVFLGRLFSFYDSATSKYSIPESIDVKGSVVYPTFKWHLLGGPAGQVGNILYALGTLLDGTFTLAHEGSNFVLYGPGSCVDLFSANTKSVSSSVTPASVGSGKVKTFQILDKSSLRVLSTERGMAKMALFVVEDYCSNHPGITLVDLQRIFAAVPSHRSSSGSIIESDGAVDAYKKRHPADTHKRFSDKQIALSDGQIVMVSNQWDENVNLDAFKKVADDLGYIINIIK